MASKSKKAATAPKGAAAGVVANVNPSLVPLLVPIEDLREDPDNANKHNERSVEDISTSFAEFGQQKPLIYKKGGTVVAGNGGLRAAKRLGWTHVAAIQFDGPSERARAYAIADNRTAEHSERDEDVLGRQLRDLAAAWDDFRPEMVGYTTAEAAMLPGGYGESPVVAEGSEEGDASEGASDGSGGGEDADPDAPGEFAEFGEDLKYDFECPKCQHKWSGKAK